MKRIKLTREEKKNLWEYLYDSLMSKAEYHEDLCPNEYDNLDTLMHSYFYWAEEYNDNYMPEEKEVETNKLAAYLVQQFQEYTQLCEIFGYTK